MIKKTLFMYFSVVFCLLLGSSTVFCDESSSNDDLVDPIDLKTKEEIVRNFENFHPDNFRVYVSRLEESKGLDLAMIDIVKSILNGDSRYDINNLRRFIASVNLSSPDGIVGLLEVISVDSKLYSTIKESIVLDLLSRLNESLVSKDEKKLLNDISRKIVVNVIKSGCDDEFLLKVFDLIKLTSKTKKYLIKKYADKVISIVMIGKNKLKGDITTVDSFLLYDNLLESDMSQIAHRILEISGKNRILKILEREDIKQVTKVQYIKSIVMYCQFSSVDDVWEILDAFSTSNMKEYKKDSRRYIDYSIVCGLLGWLNLEDTKLVYEKLLLERNLINATTVKWIERNLKDKEADKEIDEKIEAERLDIERTNNPCSTYFMNVEDIVDQM